MSRIEEMDARLEEIINAYKYSRERYFNSFAVKDLKMLNKSGIVEQWSIENKCEDVLGNIYAELILKEKLRRWKQEYNCNQNRIYI